MLELAAQHQGDEPPLLAASEDTDSTLIAGDGSVRIDGEAPAYAGGEQNVIVFVCAHGHRHIGETLRGGEDGVEASG